MYAIIGASGFMSCQVNFKSSRNIGPWYSPKTGVQEREQVSSDFLSLPGPQSILSTSTYHQSSYPLGKFLDFLIEKRHPE